MQCNSIQTSDNKNNKPRIISPDYRQGFFSSLAESFKNIMHSRELVYQLFKRDFIGVYKKSFVGLSWIAIAPIIGIVSWVFMSRTQILDPGPLRVSYPVYILVSTFIWAVFMGACQSSAETLKSGAAFISLVDFPHEVLVIKQFAQHAARLMIVFILNIGVLLIFKIPLTYKIILFPLALIPLVLLGTALGLVVSLFSAVTLDFTRVFNVFTGLLMYVTPVIYSPEPGNALLQKIIVINPLTHLINLPRAMLLNGFPFDSKGFIISFFVSFFLFIISWRLFIVSEKRVIERIF